MLNFDLSLASESASDEKSTFLSMNADEIALDDDDDEDGGTQGLKATLGPTSCSLRYYFKIVLQKSTSGQLANFLTIRKFRELPLG